MKKLIVVLIFLSGCGGNSEDPADNHGYGWEFDQIGPSGLKLRKTGATPRDAAYLEERVAIVLTCLGISAPPPPFVIYLPSDGVEPQGRYYSGPPLIVLEEDVYLEHEAVHYLLDITTGNADRNHESRAFLCSPTD